MMPEAFEEWRFEHKAGVTAPGRPAYEPLADGALIEADQYGAIMALGRHAMIADLHSLRLPAQQDAADQRGIHLHAKLLLAQIGDVACGHQKPRLYLVRDQPTGKQRCVHDMRGQVDRLDAGRELGALAKQIGRREPPRGFPLHAHDSETGLRRPSRFQRDEPTESSNTPSNPSHRIPGAQADASAIHRVGSRRTPQPPRLARKQPARVRG